MSEKSFEEIFSIFDEISNSYKRSNQYFDILYDSKSSVLITKTRTSENIVVNAKKSGIVARTFTGTWKETTITDFSDIKKIDEKLPKVANMGKNLEEYEGWKVNKEIKPKINPLEVPIDEKIQKVRDIYDYNMKFDERIINSQVQYMELFTERIFVNNEGCRLRQVIPRTVLYIIPIAKEGPVVDYDYNISSGEIGFEIFDKIDDKELNRTCEKSLEMLKAELAPSGKHTVILDSTMTGMVAHESFGHGLEADQVIRERSYLKEKLNQKVASEICTIFDSPTIEHAVGSYFFDDEGIKAGKNLLVEDGILKNFIYDRRTASALNAIPKGNGRRESFAHPVHPRMTNTYFEPGDYSLDEMIKEIKYGVILIHGSFGMEDPLGGGMQNTSKKGYLIENGEKTKLLKAVALTGSVLETLPKIDAISKGSIKIDGGTCGKGDEDHVPVGSGGTYVRIKEALISPG
ncbi:MAG: TldD/PmbA family protein [Candidatus Hodarchaeota archaeon]